ncbi:MAG: hypothetical protein D6683_03515 [Actinomyces sp.]|nr:MAG: hypothetical protein D6683_03515 [Actinomyces sp.]
MPDDPSPPSPLLSRPSPDVGVLDDLLARLRPRLRAHRTRRILVAALAAVVAWTAVRGATSEAASTRAAWQPAGPVLVVSRAVTDGAPLSPADVESRRVPAFLVPADALTELPAGARALDDLTPGEIVRAARLAPLGSSVTAARLPPGSGGVVLPADAAVGLEAGDRVDLVAFASGLTVTRGARVVRVGPDGDTTVAVSDSDRGAVVRALASGGVISVLVP